MRKIIALFAAFFWVFLCAAPVWAQEETYATAIELYHSWKGNLPEYICGAWTEDGGVTDMTFGILNNELGEAGKQEILKLVEDDSTVSFVYQMYSRNELYRIFQEMHSYFERKAGLITLGISETENCVRVEINDSYQDKPDTQNMIREMTEKYGDAVKIGYLDEAHLPVPVPAPSVSSSLRWLWAVPVVILITVLAVVGIKKNRRRSASS